MAKHNYCTKCSHYIDCGFISRGLEYKCDILDIFDAGMNAAIDKASQWLAHNAHEYLDTDNGYDTYKMIEEFKKAMQNE